jgi:hypothetical protein
MKSLIRATTLGLAVTAIAAGACQKSESPGANTDASNSTSAAPAPTPDPHPPFGILDVPRENASVDGGGWGYGWALDDSGVAAVSVSFDDGPAVPAKTGQAFGGVKEAYPTLPGNDKAGFVFAVPKLPPGPHSLTVTIVAKDGGQTTLKRQFQIK